MTTPHKLYPHIAGLRGDCGENAATLAITAVLHPSPHYPDAGRIVVGAPPISESVIGGWCSGPEAAVRTAETLLEAAADVDAVLDAVEPERITAPEGRPVPCEVCGRPLLPGVAVATWIDGERSIVAHWDPCPFAERETASEIAAIVEEVLCG
jgi:hypothetical protein